jgi:phosphatidate cytidylyltransferase
MAPPAEKVGAGLSNLQKRLLSAAVLLPVVILAIVLGGISFAVLVIVFAAAMAWEWTTVVATIRAPGETKPVPAPSAPRWGLITAISVVIAVLATWRAQGGWDDAAAPVVIVVGIVIVAIVGFAVDRPRAGWYVAGIPYVAVPSVALILLRGGADDSMGLATIVWIVALVIAADTGGYIVGRSVGGPKLAPRISPNKTWSGLGGAVLGAALAGLCTAFILNHTNVLVLTLVSALLGLLEQGGDLVESALKRHFGVKDTSQIIPGHGGVLDRVDGLLAVAVAVLVLNMWAGGSVLAW